ncbi:MULTISPECIES: hypothetical protein [Oligella]|uniref:Uncharacterized protein n=1 Tax=Oligella urethralis TaxID=90245 RepID=A0A2X1ULM2_9BURK|nr:MULTISPECIES: hypothetical protein [Oligella]OFV49740.1 hypothetical protein HMPREF3179_03780 [Oligella sp. HMSC09E12]SPY08076.1 Uncharacterised protein [Oligella urethralis]
MNDLIVVSQLVAIVFLLLMLIWSLLSLRKLKEELFSVELELIILKDECSYNSLQIRQMNKQHYLDIKALEVMIGCNDLSELPEEEYLH